MALFTFTHLHHPTSSEPTSESRCVTGLRHDWQYQAGYRISVSDSTYEEYVLRTSKFLKHSVYLILKVPCTLFSTSVCTCIDVNS